MAFLADPRASRRIHIALLRALLIFGLSTMVLSAAWLVAARDYYFDGKWTAPDQRLTTLSNKLLPVASYLVPYRLIMSASV